MNMFQRAGAWALALLLALGLLAGCSTPAVTASETAVASTPPQSTVPLADEDLDAGWDEASATLIALADGASAVTGGGATVSGDTITITTAGTYLLRGSLSNGQVVVDGGDDDLVRLVLDGASITGSGTAPLYAPACRKLVIILAEGSENTLADTGDYIYDNVDKQEPDAALFCKNDLTINGTGSLTVNAVFNNGIGAKDNLLLVGGSLTVNAANHAIRGRDSLTVLDGSYNLTAGNDGLQSNNDSGEGVGWIDIQGGDFTIVSAHDAVQAETSLAISGGSFSITAGGGADAMPTSQADESDSYKGLKAGGDIAVSDGSFVIDSADDAVHGGGNVTISGGGFTIRTGDDGMHADEALAVSGGVIDIQTSYEGLEGATVDISGGDISIVASDDGINAAGGTDSNGGGLFGGDRFGGSGVSEEYWIHISGGTIEVDAGGDGVDSNGSIEMSGGTLLVHGPTTGADGALDYELTWTHTGGTLVAAGSSGMAMAPTAGVSTQPSLMVYFTGSRNGGEALALQDENDETLVSFTPQKAYNSLVISAPGMEDGKEYTLTIGGQAVVVVTLDGMLTSINENGEAVRGGMMGGMGDMGGGRPGGGGGMPSGGRGGGGAAEDMPGEPPEGFGGEGALPALPEDGGIPEGPGGTRPA